MMSLLRGAYKTRALRYAVAMSTTSSRSFATAPAWLKYENLNENIKEAEYAVRGELVIRAMAHAEGLKKGENRPFSKLTYCNIGNPQELAQKPITYFRQVLALLNYPDMIDSPETAKLFPKDVIDRARRYMDAISGGLGSYTHSQGLEIVRNEIAQFISDRDGVPAHARDIFLTDGASPAAQTLIRAMIRDKTDGVMVPIPQYPLYSASVSLYGGTLIPYYLNEPNGWTMDYEELQKSLEKARSEGINPRSLVVINPGNPTGNTLSEENMQDIIRFCAENKLVLIADEVYQENIWTPTKEFHSFKKVAANMGAIDPVESNKLPEEGRGIQLVSLHSTSKGFTGECGRRGGYFELSGFDDTLRAELYKLLSISLCSNSTGQVLIGLQSQPPKEGEPSYELYKKERDEILGSLKRRAEALSKVCNELVGMSCESPEGSLYAFPRIRLPEKAVAAAKAAGKQPDTFYCIQLLDATGIVLVPGSGFGQREGEYHFRTTILPPENDFNNFLDSLKDFHTQFMNTYSD